MPAEKDVMADIHPQLGLGLRMLELSQDGYITLVNIVNLIRFLHAIIMKEVIIQFVEIIVEHQIVVVLV
jgi:hypothetical protein